MENISRSERWVFGPRRNRTFAQSILLVMDNCAGGKGWECCGFNSILISTEISAQAKQMGNVRLEIGLEEWTAEAARSQYTVRKDGI